MAKKKGTTKKVAKKKVGLSDFEKAAARERVRELKAEAAGKAGGKAVQDAIAGMKEPDRSMAKRIHEIVTSAAPSLKPKTWYGMPAYANEDEKVVCFFQSGIKYQARYCTLGFQGAANLDEGGMWPSAFALKKLTSADEAKITALVKKAVS